MAVSFVSPRSTISPLWALLAPILGMVLYLNVLDHDLFGAGSQLTLQNTQVTEAQDLSSIWFSPTPPQDPTRSTYRPVLALLLRMEWLTWGNSPSSFHSVNLILYVSAMVLFFLLLGQLMPYSIATLAATLTFAFHPMASESVQSVAGQGELLALVASLGACSILQLNRGGRLRLGWCAPIIGLLMAVAVGASELGLLLPLWLLSLAALTEPVKSNSTSVVRPTRRKVKQKEKVPAAQEKTPDDPRLQRQIWIGLAVLAVLVGYCLLRWSALGDLTPPPEVSSQARALVSGNAFAVGPAVVLAYLLRLLWPVHPTQVYTPATDPGVLLPSAVGWVVLTILFGLTFLACRRWKLMGLALIMLLTPLLAISHWIPLPFTMSEGPLVFALPGFCLMLAVLIQKLAGVARALPSRGWWEKLGLAVLCLIWVGMAWQVWSRGRDWKSAESLWQAEANQHPRNAAPHLELLEMYVRQSNAEAAHREAALARKIARPADLDRIVELEAALASLQKDDRLLLSLIEQELKSPVIKRRGHLAQLAMYAGERRLAKEAEALWRKELKQYPDYFDALYELADLEFKHKNYPEARRLCVLALKESRHAPEALRAKALSRYGVILAESGYLKEAIVELRAAIELDPHLYTPYIYLVRIYTGDKYKNYEMAKSLISLCAQNVNLTSYIDLADLYTRILDYQKKPAEALDWLMAVVAKYPSDVPLHLFAARYQMEHRRYDKAAQIYEHLGEVRGLEQADLFTGLGLLALYGEKNQTKAIAYWRKAIQVNPLHDEAKDLLSQATAPRQNANLALQVPSARPAASQTLPNAGTRANIGMTSGTTTGLSMANPTTPTPAVPAPPAKASSAMPSAQAPTSQTQNTQRPPNPGVPAPAATATVLSPTTVTQPILAPHASQSGSPAPAE